MSPEAKLRLLSAMVRMEVREGKASRSVTLIEDLHWMDAGSHALLLVTFRPEYHALDLELLLLPDSIGAAWDALTRCSSSIFPLGDERVEIFKIHPRRRAIDPSKFDLGELVDFTKD